MDVIGKAMPALLESLQANAQDSEKSKGLEAALSQHANDNISDLSGFLGGINPMDAQKMLGHILSGKKETLEQSLSNNTGANQIQVNSIMAMLAPMLIGMLGNHKKNNNLGIEDIAKSLGKSGANSSVMDMATKMLDKDGDGSIMDEATEFLGKFFKK